MARKLIAGGSITMSASGLKLGMATPDGKMEFHEGLPLHKLQELRAEFAARGFEETQNQNMLEYRKYETE